MLPGLTGFQVRKKVEKIEKWKLDGNTWQFDRIIPAVQKTTVSLPVPFFICSAISKRIKNVIRRISQSVCQIILEPIEKQNQDGPSNTVVQNSLSTEIR